MTREKKSSQETLDFGNRKQVKRKEILHLERRLVDLQER